jgi:hypothetical protein
MMLDVHAQIAGSVTQFVVCEVAEDETSNAVRCSSHILARHWR